MKGKSIFTKKEADEIIALITQKLKASASEQKKIRDKIRKLGFYASDFGIGGGYTVADFKKVVKIVGENSPELIQSPKPQKKPTEIKNKFIEPSNNSLNFESDTQDELKQNGFKGFKTVSEIIKNDYIDIPKERGIYILLYNQDAPEFVEVGTGGHFKSQNPNVHLDVLQESWVDDASIIYIGKAGAENSNATLHSRLKQYFRFGQGAPVGHRGGRYVWQLKNCYDILVCWKELPTGNPRVEEATLIKEFEKHYDKKPFANLVG